MSHTGLKFQSISTNQNRDTFQDIIMIMAWRPNCQVQGFFLKSSFNFKKTEKSPPLSLFMCFGRASMIMMMVANEWCQSGTDGGGGGVDDD